MGKAIKISAKFWESCSPVEKAFIEERASKNDLVTLKSIIWMPGSNCPVSGGYMAMAWPKARTVASTHGAVTIPGNFAW